MKLNFQAPITTNTGYGITSTNILKSLIGLDVDISLFPIGDVTLESVEDKNLIEPIFQKMQQLQSKRSEFKNLASI